MSRPDLVIGYPLSLRWLVCPPELPATFHFVDGRDTRPEVWCRLDAESLCARETNRRLRLPDHH